MSGRSIDMVLDTRSNFDTEVPGPNNLESAFTEFPSIPRIAVYENIVATRGNHAPVWRYLLPDGSESRGGTSGVYASFSPGESGGEPLTAASKLGFVPGFELFQVPGAPDGISFDVFPGAPAVTDDGFIAFKGNFTELVENVAVAKTGVFYRSLSNDFAGGTLPIERVATTDTEIPNVPRWRRGVKFGSTAPPSAALGHMVFVGLDVEEDRNLRRDSIALRSCSSRPCSRRSSASAREFRGPSGGSLGLGKVSPSTGAI